MTLLNTLNPVSNDSTTNSTKKYYIFSSDIATFIGQNRWNIVSPFERLWRKADKESLDTILESVNREILEDNIKICHLKTQLNELEEQYNQKKLTKRQLDLHQNKIITKIDEIQKNNVVLHDNVDGFVLSQSEKIRKEFGDEISNILKDLSISNDDKKKKTMELIQKSENTNSGYTLTEKKKEEYKNEIESLVNKEHGIRHEMSAIELFEKENDCNLDTSQKFYKKLVYTGKNGSEWFICGKMDGINHEDKYIVEVKNRTKAFFSQVRDYEKTQIQMYMYMTDLRLTKLVECRKMIKKTTIKTTDIIYDEVYTEDVLTKLQQFLSEFEMFLTSSLENKKKYLSMNSEEKEWFIHKMYYAYSTSSVQKQKSKSRDNAVCLLDSSDSDSFDELL